MIYINMIYESDPRGTHERQTAASASEIDNISVGLIILKAF